MVSAISRRFDVKLALCRFVLTMILCSEAAESFLWSSAGEASSDIRGTVDYPTKRPGLIRKGINEISLAGRGIGLIAKRLLGRDGYVRQVCWDPDSSALHATFYPANPSSSSSYISASQPENTRSSPEKYPPPSRDNTVYPQYLHPERSQPEQETWCPCSMLPPRDNVPPPKLLPPRNDALPLNKLSLRDSTSPTEMIQPWDHAHDTYFPVEYPPRLVDTPSHGLFWKWSGADPRSDHAFGVFSGIKKLFHPNSHASETESESGLLSFIRRPIFRVIWGDPGSRKHLNWLPTRLILHLAGSNEFVDVPAAIMGSNNPGGLTGIVVRPYRFFRNGLRRIFGFFGGRPARTSTHPPLPVNT